MAPKSNTHEDLQEQLEILDGEFKDLSDDIVETHLMGILVETDATKQNIFLARLSRLDNTFDKFSACFSKIKQVARKLKVETSSYEVSNKNMRSRFYECLAVGGTLSQSKTETSGNTNNDRSSREGPSLLRLPTINIPIFSGNISDWPSFKDTFSSLVHNNQDLDDVQKFHYLKSSLKGSASSLIAAINITAEGYDQAWATLTTRYDSKRLQATHHLMNIFNYPPMNKCSLANLDNFSSTVLESAASFNRLHLSDPSGVILCTFALRLLDPKTRERFENKYGSRSEAPTWKEFSDFISELTIQLQSASLISNNRLSPAHSDHKLGKGPRQVLLTNVKTDQMVCPICNKDSHRFIDCSAFHKMSPKQRFDQIKAFNRCLNCLGLGHSAAKCPSKHSCKICNLRHHSMLHFPTDTKSKTNFHDSHKPSCSKPKSDVTHSVPTPANSTSILSSSTTGNINVLLGTAQARIKDKFGKFHEIRILIDSGSQRSFITTNFADKLGLSKSRNPHRLIGFSNHPISGGKYHVPCTIAPQTEDFTELTTMAIVIDQISADMPSAPIPHHIVEKFRSWKLADTAFHQPGPIEFLLGADLFGEIVRGKTLTNYAGLPNALDTVFGWVLVGPISDVSPTSYCQTMHTTTETQLENEALPAIMSRFWEIEEVATVSKLNPDDVRAEEHFKSTHTRDVHGRYVVRLPFKNEPKDLQSSKFMAIHRFKKLEEKLSRIRTLRLEYNSVFQQYLSMQYLSRTARPGKYFLPHHGVFKDSSTTHLRIVFDASAQTNSGSLNSFLLTGPKLQHDIKDILLKFRIPKFVVSADIGKMFLQILIHSEDRLYHHLFFRFDSTDAIQEYEFNRLPFGLSCSPFLAIRVIQQLVSDEGDHYPLASRALLENMYIDDLLAGAETLDEALKLQGELIALLSKGGFTLKKWCSNEQELVKNVASEEVESTVSLCNIENTTIKILGMHWEPNEDRLTYRYTPKDIVLTKRGIMSSIARMYDPLGYLSPVIFRAKTILQQLWKLKIGWDDPVPSSVQSQWELFFSELNKLSQISLPRRVCSGGLMRTTIIGFADASSWGYAAVIYLRTETENRSVSTSLVFAKTRLAPVKPVTIPRLELCAAVLLVETIKSLHDILPQWKDTPTYLFNDSATVLAWLKLPFHQLKTFVANRVAKNSGSF